MLFKDPPPPPVNVGDRVRYTAKYSYGKDKDVRDGVVTRVRYVIKDAIYRASFLPDGYSRDVWVKTAYLVKL